VAGALGWGALAASSLIFGALIGVARPWPDRLVGVVLAFGAGALISAVSFDLAEEGVQLGGGDSVALALGGFLDGVPEQLVLGIGLAAGDGVSVGLLAAIFISNLPEAVGSATDMRSAGRTRAAITGLWTIVAVICTFATVVGYGIADTASGDVQAAINGFAAGALLVMLIDSMIPEAARQAGRVAGLATVFGFAVAAGLSSVS
jgi:ZIP family zinc transporter